MQTMYPAIPNSPVTELASAIDATQTTIPLVNATVLPDAPNLATIGIGETAETILYTGKSGNDLTGVTRGFQGSASAWGAGQKVARYFTAYDHDAFRLNIEEHETDLSSATAEATANTLAKRDANACLKVANPSAATDAANRQFVETITGLLTNLSTTQKTNLVAAINEVFQLGNEKKSDLVDALIAIGLSASTSESWDDLIAKVAAVIRATGNAVASDVLSGRTFSNASANGITGTMANRGAISATLSSQGQEYTVQQGYHSGSGKVTANISNLTAGNIRSGATVGGVAGTFSQFSNGATAAQILTGRSAAVNGSTVNGTMANRTGHVTGQSVSRSGTTVRIRPQAGYYPGDSGNSVQISDANFVASNIRSGVSLFGLTGTLIEGNPSAWGNLFGDGTARTISGLSFTPSIVYFISKRSNGDIGQIGVLVNRPSDIGTGYLALFSGNTFTSLNAFNSNYSISTGSFTFFASSSNSPTYYWLAYQ